MIKKQTILLVAILGMVFLSSSTVNAQLCDDTRCKTCTSQGVATCDVCIDGYKVLEGKCTSCADNYTKVSPNDSRCVRCTDSNCKVCAERDICTECTDSTKFTLKEGQCEDIDPPTVFTSVVGCEYTKMQNSCDRCNTNRKQTAAGDLFTCNCDIEKGFVETTVQNVTKCSPCTLDRCNSCSVVDQREQCNSCETGYILDSTKTKCVCAVGYGLDLTSSVCRPCSVVGCSECAADRTKCTRCVSGQNLVGETCQSACPAQQGYHNGEGECTVCQDNNCADCGENHTICKTCVEKAIQIQNLCAQCDIVNCSICMLGEKGIVCEQCNDGFTADETRLKCNAPTVTCPSGQGLNSDKACQACKVQNCTVCSQNSSSCETCKDGFQFNSTSNFCDQETVQCAAGQGKNTSTGACAACVDKNCADCLVDNTKCIQCNEGQGFSLEKVCEACEDTFCTTCPESSLKCQTCQNGYIVNNSGKCDLISTNTCADGTGLNDKKECVACGDSNCAKCAAAFGTCDSCKVGFTFNSLKQCITTTPVCQIDGCSQCKSETVCGVCKTGFFSHLGKCVQSCPQGFGPESDLSNICVKCSIANCATCPKGFATCLTCAQGYVFDSSNGVCNVSTAPACQLPNCSECDTTGVCKSCNTGFSLGRVNGKQVCYQGTTDLIETPLRQCGTLIPNCSSCSLVGTTRDIVCKECILGQGPCTDGNFLLKQDASFSNCVRQFEPQECKMEGCLKCLVRVSLHSTCTKELPQCLEAQADYQIVGHNGQRIAVLKDLTKYNNIDLKSPIPNCSELSIVEGQLVCKTCVSGFLVGDNGGCRLNECFTKFANCKVCETTCKECAFGFALSSAGTCVQSRVDCSSIPGCKICQTDVVARTLVCGACSEGFVLKENKCEQCADCVSTVVCNPNCGSCLNQKECTTCAKGFTNAPFCNQCEQRDLKFIPEQFACVPRCFPPQVFDFQSTTADKECTTPTIQNCLRFATLASGALSCNQCIEGFGVVIATAGNTCKACSIKGCLTCQFDNTGQEFCGACVKDLTLRDNACVTVNSDGNVVTTPVQPAVCNPTTQQLSQCSQCYFKGTLAICAACNTGFQLSNRGTCTRTCTDTQYLTQDGACADCKSSFCAQGCFLSTSASKEIAPSVICRDNLCIDGYYFDKEKLSCVAQPTNLTCASTQFIANGACRDCPKGCKSCQSLRSCNECIDGFTLDTVNGICFIPKPVESVKQVTCLTNCERCETAAFCLACQPGFLLSERKNECVIERKSCLANQFLRNNQCIACSEISKDCVKCVSKEGQGVCTEFTKKTECAANEMKIVTGDSFICREDKTCLQFDAQNNCLKCLNGSVPVPIEASKPDSRKICNTCANSNADGVCITCPKNCLKCKEESTTQIVCLPDSCDPRFDLKDGVCVEKPRECDSPLIRNTATNRCECPFLSQFNSAGICECIDGLVWNTNKTQGCKKPEASDCEAGFRKDADGKCVACSNRIITFDDDGTTKEDYTSKFCESCSGDICDLCREGSFLIKEKNVCHQCEVGCAHCAGIGKCLRCVAGKFLNNGKCSDTCDAGTLPSVKSYFTMNKNLFASQANTEIYQKTAFKADTSITSLEKCGEPIAVGEYTFCQSDANVQLPFSSSPTPIDVATQVPITLECLPCRNLCKSCVAGLILDPNGNKCVRECPLGFSAQKNDSTGQVTCVAAVIQSQDSTKVTLETKVVLESRLPELVRGFTVQNIYQRTKLFVKNSLPDQKLVHTLQLSAVYLLGKGEQREQVPENLLQDASKEVHGEFAATISTSFKVDENSIFLPANFFQSNYVYKLTVVSTQLAADGKTVEAESSASTLVAVVERDSFVKLESDIATISVASEKLNALDKQCASLVIRDLINYSTSDQFLVSISYRQAYVDSKDTMEPNQVTESSLENVFCFNAPFVQVQTNFQVNFQLSLNGVHRTGVRFFTVIPPRDTAAVDSAFTAKLKEASDLADTTDANQSTEMAIPQTQFLDLVSIITVQTEDTVQQTVTQVKPTDTVPTTVEAQPTDVLCSLEQPDVSCNNNGKCVLNQNVPVCECQTGFDPVTNCKQQWTADQDAQITQSNEQLLTVLKAANQQSSVSSAVNTDQRLSDSVKVEISAQILNVPIKDVAVAKEAVKLLTTLTSSAELPAQQVLQALSTGVRTVQKLLRTPQQQVGGRFLTEQEIDKEEQQVQADVALALDKVCDQLEVDNNREDTEVTELVSEVYNLRVAQVNPVSDPKIQQIAQEIAAQDDKGQRIISRLPREIFDGQQNAAVRTFTQSQITAKSENNFTSNTEFTIKVTEDSKTATGGKRILTKVEVANLAQPAEFCFDTTQLEAKAKELQQNIQFYYLNKETNTWVNDPQVTFNLATKCGETKHFSTFAVGLGDSAITDGSSSGTVNPTDGTTTSNTSTNPNPQTKPEAIGVNSNLLQSFIAVFATITLFFIAF